MEFGPGRVRVNRELPDVVCLQEIKAAREQVPDSLRAVPAYHCYWHGERAYSGVGLLIRHDIPLGTPEYAHPDFDYETRIVVARLGSMAIACVYVPNGGKDFAAKLRFLEAMEGFAATYRSQGIDLLICGDMNVARTDQDVHPKERKPDAIGQRPEERALFERIIASGGLIDVARVLDPDNDRLFTWWPPWRNMRAKNIGWRLDYVLASRSLQPRIVKCSVLADVGTSDHAPVIAEILYP